MPFTVLRPRQTSVSPKPDLYSIVSFRGLNSGHLPGLYLPSYLQFDLNWKPFHGSSLGFAQGIFIHHCPGHTPGLCIIQINLKKSGTWIFTSDQYIVRENYDSLGTQGWLTRDHHAWSQSNQMVHFLQKITKAKVIFGHDREVFQQYQSAPHYYT
jgi:glyoxylase-like metal-dependent hydrolase (beta-lactamase superfamily II)